MRLSRAAPAGALAFLALIGVPRAFADRLPSDDLSSKDPPLCEGLPIREVPAVCEEEDFRQPPPAADIAGEPPRPGTTGQDATLKERFKAGARNVRDDGVYLLTFHKRVTRKGVAAAAWTGGGIGALILLDDEIRREVQERASPSSDQWARRVEHLGDARNTALGALAAYGAGRLFGHEPTAETGRALLEALLFTETIDMAAKGLFGRARPGDGNRASDFFHGSSSFPSGHTSRAFAVATVLAERHGPIAAWIGYPLATLVGLSRLEGDVHWSSDVLAGAALGHVIAKAITKRRESRARNEQEIRIYPSLGPGPDSMGVALRVTLGGRPRGGGARPGRECGSAP